MGASFGLAALVPILPYLFLPVNSALCVSVAAGRGDAFLGWGRSRAAGRVAAGWRVDLKSLRWARSPVSPDTSSARYCPRRSAWRASQADTGRSRSLVIGVRSAVGGVQVHHQQGHQQHEQERSSRATQAIAAQIASESRDRSIGTYAATVPIATIRGMTPGQGWAKRDIGGLERRHCWIGTKEYNVKATTPEGHAGRRRGGDGGVPS